LATLFSFGPPIKMFNLVLRYWEMLFVDFGIRRC